VPPQEPHALPKFGGGGAALHVPLHCTVPELQAFPQEAP